jgi:hypothetical protein
MFNEKFFLLLAQYRFFWKAIQQWKGLIFKSKKNLHNIREEANEIKQEYDYFRIIQSWVFNPMSLAIIFAFGLQLSNYPIYEFKSLIREVISESLLIRFDIAPSSDYVTFLTAISAVGSVLIGLYYAALMSIQSALYSKLPSNIRDLLSQEKLGNVYMKFLAFVTFLSFVLVAFRLIGFEKIFLVPIVMLVFAGISIFAFIMLGKVAFNFFDPTKLSISVFVDLDKSIKSVMVHGRYSSDKNFQNYEYKIASNRCEILSTLCDYVLNQKHLSIDGSIGLNTKILNLLSKYSYLKKEIDPKSLWYEQRYQHKNWYQLNNLEIYSHVGMYPEPIVLGNILWFEKRLMPLIINSVEKNFRNKNFTAVREIIKSANQYINILAYHHDISMSLEIIQKIEKVIFNNDNFLGNEIEVGAIIDITLMAKIQIFLTYLDKLKDENLINDEQLKRIDWLDQKSIYLHDFDVYLLDELNDLQKRLNFEIRIENKIITPWWYQNELLKRVKTEKIVENLSFLFSSDIFTLPDKINSIPLLKAAYLSRKWEYLQKVLIHFETIQEHWNELKMSRKIDFNWKEIDLIQSYKNLIEQKNFTLKEMGLTNLQLANIEHSQEHPDYFGQFNTAVENELIDVVLNNDIDTFIEIFPPYFSNSLSAFDRLKPTESEFNIFLENKLVGAFAPILDLLDICGYAKVFSDFSNDQRLWNIVIHIWDHYFLDSPEKMTFFANGVSLSESRFALAPRDVIRTSWQQKVVNFLSEHVVLEEYFEKGGFVGFVPRHIALHSSPLVRIFVRDRHYWISNDGIDVFIHYYFNQKSTDRLDFGMKRNRRVDEDKLNREIEKYNEYLKAQNEN